jgi:glycosyltransferase involved in cell wall biosynthesis
MSRPGPLDRIRQTRRLLDGEGVAGVVERIASRAADRLTPRGRVRLPVSKEDLVRAGEIAAGGWVLPEGLPVVPGQPLTIGWVLAPPGPGSGGHRTMFRMVHALEEAGHTCVLYLVDRHGWSIEQHRATFAKWWPELKAEVRDAAEGIDDGHALFATDWASAYRVLATPARGVRFYFVQDNEQWFYPRGSEALLAEATYRFGFHGVTAGAWLSLMLEREYGMSADPFNFGCDLSRYSLDPAAQRTGICYYARYTKPRRAFELGLVALELFAERHPEVDIHLYGDDVGSLPFKAVNHGSLTPEACNELYQRCHAGLVLSATNVSLVPHEMLAAGCLPVVNDAEHNRVVLDNDHVVYAPSTPFELADALSRIVERPAAERDAEAEVASRSVQGCSWAESGQVVERIVRRVVEERAARADAVAA